LREKYENEIYDIKMDYEDRISVLVSKIEKIENELQNLDSYKRDKELHDSKFAQLQTELLSEQHNNVLMLEDQERYLSTPPSHHPSDLLSSPFRKFLESKAQMMKDLEEQKFSYNEIAMKEAREAMDAESKKLVIENKRINEELKFHNVISYEFQIEKDRLEIALATAKREVVLLTEKEQEYAKQNYTKTREIKALRERFVLLLPLFTSPPLRSCFCNSLLFPCHCSLLCCSLSLSLSFSPCLLLLEWSN
jgi:hypothetical protein